MGNGCDKHEDKIIAKLEKVEDNLSKKIGCIEKKLLEPDDGLYTRVRKNTEFRKTAKRWLSVISVGFVGATIKAAYEFFKGK